jgi:hypothetical protein
MSFRAKCSRSIGSIFAFIQLIRHIRSLELQKQPGHTRIIPTSAKQVQQTLNSEGEQFDRFAHEEYLGLRVKVPMIGDRLAKSYIEIVDRTEHKES